MALSRLGPADLLCPIGGGLVEQSTQSAMRRSAFIASTAAGLSGLACPGSCPARLPGSLRTLESLTVFTPAPISPQALGTRQHGVLAGSRSGLSVNHLAALTRVCKAI